MRVRNVRRVLATCGVLATMGLAGAVFAQTQSPPAQSSGEARTGPQPSSPAAASSPHQRNVTGQSASEAAPNQNPNPTAASSPHQRSATRLAEGAGGVVSSGMTVDDRSGQNLGTVAEVSRLKSGQRYVAVTGSDGSTTPVPYHIASSMMAEGKVVLDRAAFEQAPKLNRSELSGGSGSWQKKVDQYWRKHSE